jgi:tRNA threonylcarbamoyladenosine biosynthesis protein TsaB
VLLAIDTSTATASVALYDQRVVAETTWLAGRDHSRQLLPQVQALLAALGRSVADLTGLGVALGPGSFNGLRVGISTAKAIAEARGLPIVGVETLLALAYQFRLTGRPIRPLFEAARGELATGLYQAAGERFLTLEEPHLSTLDDAWRASPPETLFCGELKPAGQERLAEWLGPRAVAAGLVVRPAENARRAGFLAELAWQSLQAGRSSDLATLQPVYLRRPAISSGAVRPVGSATS